MTGVVYVVSTPIGNLDDVTLRAIQVLQAVSMIAAEDTRTTRKLLTRHSIKTRLVRYDEHSGDQRKRELLDVLTDGHDIAIVSEAGTPTISDPGYVLVQLAIANNFQVVSIPGPSAVLAALVVSGLPTDSFRFEGFLPSSGSKRKTKLASLVDERSTLIFYEAPHRIAASIADMAEILGDRQAALCRELTKLYEEVRRGTLSSIAESLAETKALGEMVVVVGGAGDRILSDADLDSLVEEVQSKVESGMSTKDAVDLVSTTNKMPRRKLYDAVNSRGVGK